MKKKNIFYVCWLVLLFLNGCVTLTPKKHFEKMPLPKELTDDAAIFPIRKDNNYRKNTKIFFGNYMATNEKQILPKDYDNKLYKKGEIETSIEKTVNEYIHVLINKKNNEKYRILLKEEVYYLEKYKVTMTKKSTTKDGLISEYREEYKIFAKKKNEEELIKANIKWFKDFNKKDFSGWIFLPNNLIVIIEPVRYKYSFVGYYFKIDDKIVAALDMSGDRFIVKNALKEEIVSSLAVIITALFFEENLKFYPTSEVQLNKSNLIPFQFRYLK